MQCEAAAHPLRFELLVIVCTTNDIHDFKSRCVLRFVYSVPAHIKAVGVGGAQLHTLSTGGSEISVVVLPYLTLFVHTRVNS